MGYQLGRGPTNGGVAYEFKFPGGASSSVAYEVDSGVTLEAVVV